MVKHRRGFEHNLEHEIDQRRDPGQDHDQNPERDRKQNLAEMKSRRRSHIEVEIGMVDVMETPKEWQSMIRPVPPVIRPTHEEKRHDCAEEWRQMDPVQYPEPVPLGPERMRQR